MDIANSEHGAPIAPALRYSSAISRAAGAEVIGIWSVARGLSATWWTEWKFGSE
ncbi:MAG: hypothetical protein HRU17_22700 [Polyangiaceae bacterium]|nr:hypothetical protein [Polyangiaceae bacterium]